MIRVNSLIAIGIGVSALLSCKKDKIPIFPVPEPTKWELISGSYKVYNTTGVYLYDMNIMHVPNENLQYTDSLRFENFDGEFTFTHKQSTASNAPKTQIYIGYHDTLYDSNNKRWKIHYGLEDEIYNNVLKNDTIKMQFRKTNINYWLEDLVPYYECYCRQIAVKQH